MADVLATIARIGQCAIVAVVRAPDAAAARETCHRLKGAGIGVIEVTFTVPRAGEAISALASECGGTLVGAGTVLRADQAREAVAAGARFLLSPTFTAAAAERRAMQRFRTSRGCSRRARWRTPSTPAFASSRCSLPGWPASPGCGR